MNYPAFHKTALGAALAVLTLAAPAVFAQTVSVELLATEDARTQGGTPDGNFPTQPLVAATQDGHRSFIQFDLSALPLNATIDSAELVLGFALNNGANNLGPKDVEVGRVDGPWDENAVTWNTQPAVTWGGPVRTETVDATPGDYAWDITGLVRRWYNGTDPDYGIGVRGRDDGNNTQKLFFSSETPDPLDAPRLAVTYTIDDGDPTQPRPDVGDAPDSTNHHAIVNTAYPVAGIAGQFPTVVDPATGTPVGPRHANETGEAILGQYLSRELEADLGPDQDTINNILFVPALGAPIDTADNDRGDDGWRNRSIRFYDCTERDLVVRVSKAQNAQRKRMYLNVWFDGNRDGAWDDIARCEDPSGGPAEASYEWIVQDHIIDMTAIPAGGFLDFSIETEKVLNHTPGLPHWMRFTLSELPAVRPNNPEKLPDGRGPHPQDNPRGFEFGETEDVFQRPKWTVPDAPDVGELQIQARVITDSEPVPYADSVIYEVRLRHEGGTDPMDVRVRDELPYPLHLNRQIDDQGDIFLIDTDSRTGGVLPLEADLVYKHDSSTGAVTQVVTWEGTMEPDSEIAFSFEVHVHPVCLPNAQLTTITHHAQAQELGESGIEALADFSAACPGYSVPTPTRVSDLEPDWDILQPREL